MLVFIEQNTEEYHNINTADKTFENVAKFNILERNETTLITCMKKSRSY